MIVLYNSNLAFFTRMYDSLNIGLSPIRLRKSLESILKTPMIYIRDMIPQPCFQALSRYITGNYTLNKYTYLELLNAPLCLSIIH